MEDEWVDIDALPLIASVTPLPSANGVVPEPSASWTPVDLGALPEKPPAEPTLGSMGIAYAGKRHVFSGPQESAKTLLAYGLGLNVLREGGGFCLIDFEMGAWDARTRLRELGATDDELSEVIYFEPYEPITDEVVKGIINRDPAIVVIDAAAGAYEVQGLDDNKRQDVERFTSAYVRTFWKHGVATVVLDHVVKSAEARGRYAIGSERKVGGADVHLGFEVVHAIKRGGRGEYKIITHKDRGGFLKRGLLMKMHLASDPDTHRIEMAFEEPSEADAATKHRYTGYMEKVSRYLEHQIEEVKIGEVKEFVAGKSEYVVAAVDSLVAEDYVTESHKGRSRLLLSVSAYREASDPLVFHPFPNHSQNHSQEPGTKERYDVNVSFPHSPPKGNGNETTSSVSSGTGTIDIPF